MPSEKFSKSDIVLHLYDVAQNLIDLIANSSKENQIAILERLGNAEKEYVGDDSWYNWVVTAFRKRGPELKQLIKVLEVETDALARLQAFKTFIKSGGWTSTSANTAIFNEILKEISTDFTKSDRDFKKFVIKALKKEMINTINAKEAEFNRILEERDIERKEREARAEEITRLKAGIIITNDLAHAEKFTHDKSKSVIYYTRKEPIYQFFWLDQNQNEHRLIHSDLKAFYSKTELTESLLSREELNHLKEIVLECVCEIKQSLDRNPKTFEHTDKLTAVNDQNSSQVDKDLSAPVSGLVDKSFLENLKNTLEIKHQIKAPSASSSEVKNIEPPKRSDIKLKYSPDFFKTLENHLGNLNKRPKPKQAASIDITTGPDGSIIGKIDKSSVFFKNLEEHFSKDRKLPDAVILNDDDSGPNESKVGKLKIPEAVAKSLGAGSSL